MKRITHTLTQGEPSWHAFRADHFGASEASAMLGLSPYKTRDELLAEKKTGLTKEVSASTLIIFAKGHKIEKEALIIVEHMIESELYPVTMSFGKLSASCDGLDLESVIAWENKQFNKAHFEQVKNGELPEIHWPQCQQVLHVTGAEKLFFTISDGTEENTVGVWVYPDEAKINSLLSGWNQFEKDLETYVPPVHVEKVVAETIEKLPVPSVVVKGEITQSNLNEITPLFDNYLESIKTELSNDQDFADAEANAKNCRETAKRIQALRENIIAQMVDVNTVDSALANYETAFNKIGLQLEKAVKEQKETLKTNAILKAKNEYAEFVSAIKCSITLHQFLLVPNFAEAIKGVKTVASMQSRINDELARGKENATSVAKNINAKLAFIEEASKGYEHLISAVNLVTRDIDYIKLHIASVKEQEDARKKEAEERIKAVIEADRLEKEALKISQAQYEAELVKPEGISLASNDGLNVVNSNSFATVFNATEPTRNDIISLVAGSYKTTPQKAESWLLSMFATKQAA